MFSRIVDFFIASRHRREFDAALSLLRMVGLLRGPRVSAPESRVVPRSRTPDSWGLSQRGTASLPGPPWDTGQATRLAALAQGPIRISQEFAGDDDCVRLSGKDDVFACPLPNYCQYSLSRTCPNRRPG